MRPRTRSARPRDEQRDLRRAQPSPQEAGDTGETVEADAWPRAIPRGLPNGLQVICAPLEHLHTAHVIVFVRVGSRFEGPDDGGLSHLLEHVLFRGCEAYPSTWALNTAFESCSSGLDAATSRDYTTFEASCEPGAIPRVLELIGAMLSAPLFADVELEKQVIAEELQDELDGSGRDVDVDNIAKMAMFPGPGFGAKIGGRLERVARLQEADCRRWFEAFYGASNIVVSVAGPIDPELVFTAAAATLGALRPGGRRHPPAPVRRRDLPALVHAPNTGSQAEVQLAWASVPEDHPDWPALLMAQRVLDDGSCARLRHRVVDQLGLAYHASAELEAYCDLTVLSVETQTRHGGLLRAVDALLEVVRGLREAPVPDVEFARVRGRLAFELASVRDSPGNVAYWFGLQNLYAGADGLESRARRIAQVTSGAVHEACRRHLDERQLQLTVVGDLDPLDRAALRRRVHRMRQGAGAARPPGST